MGYDVCPPAGRNPLDLVSDEWSAMKSAKMRTCPLRTSCHGLRGQKNILESWSTRKSNIIS